MKYSAAFSLAAIATLSTTDIAAAQHHVAMPISPYQLAETIIHHNSAEVVTHNQSPEALLRNQTIQWNTSPKDFNLRGQYNRVFSFYCPPGSAVDYSVWGTDTYTDDSSICTAAVHAGLFSPEIGGDVSLQMVVGQTSYTGTERNDIVTKGYGSWGGSFQFTTDIATTIPTPEQAPVNVAIIKWNDNLAHMGLGGNVGARYNFFCPAGGPLTSSVWGTGVYTNDSSLCKAAVHAGEIEVQTGGTVTVEVIPGQNIYVGSDRNGVNTSDYGAWDGSFMFTAPPNR